MERKTEMKFMGFLITLAGVAFWITVTEYWDDLKKLLNEIHPAIIPVGLGILITIGIIVFVYDYTSRNSKKQPLSDEQRHLVASKVSHSFELKKIYSRIASIRIEKNEQDILIFVISPRMMHDPNEDVPLEEKRRRIQEYADTPMTPLDAVQEAPYALQHLEDKKYRNINKHWKKAQNLLEKYNKKNGEKTKAKINEALQLFRQELFSLEDRLNNDHIMDGKCDSCP